MLILDHTRLEKDDSPIVVVPFIKAQRLQIAKPLEFKPIPVAPQMVKAHVTKILSSQVLASPVVIDPFVGSYRSLLPILEGSSFAAGKHTFPLSSPPWKDSLWPHSSELLLAHNGIVFDVQVIPDSVISFWRSKLLKITMLRAIFIDGICKLLGDFIKIAQEKQKARARTILKERSRCRAKVKSVLKPLQIIPSTLHPIESLA